MEILILLIFISFVLVVLGLGFFAWIVRSKTFEHGERLALLPLSDDDDDPPSSDDSPRRR